MFLYFPLLIITLCLYEGLSSIEVFDIFDDSVDFELPALETFAKSTSEDVKFQHGNPTACLGNGCLEKSIDNDKRLNGNITKTSFMDKSTNNTNNITYNGNITKTSFMDKSTNNTNNISNNETADKNGGLQQYSLNITTLEGLIGTSKYNKSATLPAFPIPIDPSSCPENEPPANIGPYEVPTQRDVVFHIRSHLLAMYQGFHTKAMHFLKDVKEATQASWSRKMFCRGPTELMHYRRCVRWVGDMSVLTTKSLVTALESAKHNINTFIQGKICNIKALSVDPIHLIRILAAEKVSLEFTLPDFLRQLDACARHCPSSRKGSPRNDLKTSHLTDQDFVIRHYLTQQNYNQQLNQKYNI